MKKWIISKNGKAVCVTTVQYQPHIEKSMKKAGYNIKEVEDEDNGKCGKYKKQ